MTETKSYFQSCIKMNGYHFRGSNFILVLTSFLNRDQLKELTPLPVDHLLEEQIRLKGISRLDKQTGSHKSCFPLSEWRK